MNITPTRLPEVLLIEPKVFDDERGFFFESFNQHLFEQAVGRPITFVQDNHSFSKRGVLRGLHYQVAPQAQGKLVRVVQGEVFDVAVNIRHNSPQYGQWIGMHLSAENKRQLWIPEGFAHGFFAISETSQLLYKTTDYYSPAHERTIAWNDQTVDIKWPFLRSPTTPQLSNKDNSAGALPVGHQ
jgi:dTDP-4-dehydrorhamnose 3,5-epimerase